MEVKIENDNLIITLPVKKDLPSSASKKTKILASTGGNKKVEINGCVFWLGVNCYTYSNLLDESGFDFSKKPVMKKKKKALTAKEKKEVEEHNRKVSEEMSK